LSFCNYTGSTVYTKFLTSNYSGTTIPTNYLSKLSFCNYSGNTANSCFARKGFLSTYTGTTAPTTYLTSNYSGSTAPATFASKSNAITGATNLGTGTTIYTSVLNNKIQVKSIKSTGNIKITNDSNHIILSGSSQTTTATFVLGNGYPIALGSNVTNILYSPITGTITTVLAYAKTAPTGANLIFDINKNGTSLWNLTQANKITIAANSNTGSQTSFDTTAINAQDVLSIDVDQIGSLVAGQDITIQVFIVKQ
jgi:hypothetical protein